MFLLGFLAMLIFLMACREEPSPTDSATATQPRTSPIPTEPPENRPPGAAAATSTATLQPTATGASPAATAEPATPAPPPASPTPESNGASDEVAAIRKIVKEYWEALNEYDVDRAILMLEPGYRSQEEQLIRRDIGRMKLFRVRLQVSEETPPTLNGNGDYETYLTLKTPVDTRRAKMIFSRIDGQWWIIFSGQINE